MRSTLFFIPHADPVFGIPLFGVGWLLGLWAVGSLLLIAVLVQPSRLEQRGRELSAGAGRHRCGDLRHRAHD